MEKIQVSTKIVKHSVLNRFSFSCFWIETFDRKMKLLVENYSHCCQISCFSKGAYNQNLHNVKRQPVNVIILLNVCQHIFLTL